MNTNIKRIKLINSVFFIILLIILFGFLIIRGNINRKGNRAIGFKGEVENVRYDIKGIPYVTINKKEYYLNHGYRFEYKIQKGDSLIKKEGSNEYKLIKKLTGTKYFFEN